MKRFTRRLAVAMLACLPLASFAQASATYAAGLRQGAAAGAASSEPFRVEALAGSAYAAAQSSSSNFSLTTGVRPEARFARPAASLAASPVQAIVGRPLALRAMIATDASLAGTVRFTSDGSTVAGCEALPVEAIGAAAGVATCRIDAAGPGTHRYAAAFTELAEGDPAIAAIDVAATASVDADYSDLWWGGAAQNGWGISIAQHGGMQFNVLFTYDADGKPLWYVMPGGSWDAAHTTFTGALYTPSSAPFDAYVASRMQVGPPVGTASIRFTSGSTAQLAYTIDGITGGKSIERQPIAADDAAPRLQVNDMWWGGEAQNGWGMNIAQQGRMLFATWFSYDAGGRDTWFVVPGGTWNGAAFTGDLYATAGSPWLGSEYSPASFATEKVGSMTLDFADQGFATMTYTVRGVTQSKTIVRQPY